MWNEFAQDFAKLGVSLVTLSTDRLKYGIELRENKGLALRILSDEKGSVVKAYGVDNVRRTEPPQALPAVIVIDKKGRIAYRHVAYDPRVRMGPEKILKVVTGLIQGKQDPVKDGDKPSKN